jgi:pimeloyl-ACP methyl ester carboxylesterase
MDLVVDGLRIFAATGGRPFDAALPAVVFVHGAGMDHTVWTLQSRWFAHHGRAVLAVDLPGHGRSAGPPLASVEAMADFLPGLLDAAGAADAAVVGHSMGALVALAAAARHPARVRALALLGVAAAMPVHPKLLAAARADAPEAVAMIADWAFGRRAQLGGAASPGAWMVGGGTRLLERSPPGTLGVDLAACDAWSGGIAAAKAVRCPVACVLGAVDRMTPPAGARALVEALSDVRQTVLPGIGHMAMVEAPDATLAALAQAC